MTFIITLVSFLGRFASQPLNFLGHSWRKFIVGKYSKRKSQQNSCDEDKGFPRISKMIVDESFFGEVNDEGHRIEQHNFLIICRHQLQGIDNWRSIKKN